MSLARTVLPCTRHTPLPARCEENKLVGNPALRFGFVLLWGQSAGSSGTGACVRWDGAGWGTHQCHASHASMTAPARVTAAGGVLEWEKIEEFDGNRH